MGFNKSSQKSESSNKAFDFLKGQLGGSVGAVESGVSGIGDLLSGRTSGFDAFKRATGFDRRLVDGLSGVTGAGAARGMLRSGSTTKALQGYGQQLQNDTAQQYIQNLLGMGGLGMGAAQTIAGAGQTSASSGKSKGLQLNPGSWGG